MSVAALRAGAGARWCPGGAAGSADCCDGGGRNSPHIRTPRRLMDVHCPWSWTFVSCHPAVCKLDLKHTKGSAPDGKCGTGVDVCRRIDDSSSGGGALRFFLPLSSFLPFLLQVRKGSQPHRSRSIILQTGRCRGGCISCLEHVA